MWLNGIEVNRKNVLGNTSVFSPDNANAGAVTFLAGSFQLNGFVTALRMGTNVLAIQPFNVGLTDVDFHVNPELTLSFADLVPPVLQSVTPAPGRRVTNFAQLSVVFSEPVTNVQPVNLLLNGLVATSVTTNDATNTFRFNLPPPGLLTGT